MSNVAHFSVLMSKNGHTYTYTYINLISQMQGSTVRTAQWPGASMNDGRDVGPVLHSHESLSFACVFKPC